MKELKFSNGFHGVFNFFVQTRFEAKRTMKRKPEDALLVPESLSSTSASAHVDGQSTISLPYALAV